MILHMVTSLRKTIKQLALVLVSTFVCLGLMQTDLQAAPLKGSNSTLDLEKTEQVSPDSLSEKRAERRQAQSEASKAANTEDKTDSVGEVFADKLNLEEIAEDNVLLGEDPTPDTPTSNP